MTTEDRELLAEIRSRLHGISLTATQITDSRLGTEIELRLNDLITWLRERSKRNAKP